MSLYFTLHHADLWQRQAHSSGLVLQRFFIKKSFCIWCWMSFYYTLGCKWMELKCLKSVRVSFYTDSSVVTDTERHKHLSVENEMACGYGNYTSNDCFIDCCSCRLLSLPRKCVYFVYFVDDKRTGKRYFQQQFPFSACSDDCVVP